MNLQLGPPRGLVLTQPSVAVQRVLDLAGLNAYVRFFSDVPAALVALPNGK